MVRMYLLLILFTITTSGCNFALPSAMTNATPSTNNRQASITETIRAINTPTATQPTVTVTNALVVTMRALNMEQKICVGAQIGKERVPQIVQSGEMPNATEVAIITQCATASMPLINGMYTPTPR